MSANPLPPLLPNLQIVTQEHGPLLWYAVKGPDKRFVRMGRKEYLIASALDGRSSAAEVAHKVNELPLNDCVSEQEVLQVATWMSAAGLLQNAASSQPPQPQVAGLAVNPVYFKIPLIAGARLEALGGSLVAWLTWPVLLGIALLWLCGLVCVLQDWQKLARLTGELFVADQWLWWLLAWLLLKSVHEFGHAVFAVRAACSIRSAGLSLIFLAPVPYVDLSDLWAIPSRWQRILACAGGMLAELTIASLAAVVAATTDNQTLQYFCCAVLTLGTVATLAFNANPLIRLDGYYILSDLLKYPNLYTEAQLATKQLWSFCCRPWRWEARPHLGLCVYGLACLQYRLLMLLSLAILTVLTLQGIGVILVVWGAYATVIVPWRTALRKRRQLTDTSSPSAGSPPRGFYQTVAAQWEMLWSGGLIAALCGLVAVTPAPVQPTFPGTVAHYEPVMIRAETEGFLSEVFVRGQATVRAGEVIARLSNPELESELALKLNELSQLQETIALKRAQGLLAESQAASAKYESLVEQVQQLQRRVDNLIIRSSSAGYLVSNDLSQQVGLFLKAGEPLAMLASPGQLQVIASVSQLAVERWRAATGQPLVAHIDAQRQAHCVLEKVEPRASDVLSEPLLAAIYGGPLSVSPQRSSSGDEELKLLVPRFEARLRVLSSNVPAAVPGQLVWLQWPGQPATLLDLLGGWWRHQWQQLVQQVEPLG